MKNQIKILVAEDEENIREGLIDALEMEGHKVTGAKNGSEALKFYTQWHPDLIILDIMMPVKSGYDVCREIRNGNSQIPIIMLTAKGEEIDKVLGLELGADDYVCKPFGLRELMARINAVLRRSQLLMTSANKGKVGEGNDVIEFGNIKIETKKMTGRRGNDKFEITQKEIEILQYLIANKNEVVKKNELFARVWGPDYLSYSRTIDQTIANLRKKIEIDTRKPQFLKTVYGIGYKFCD